MIIKLAHVEYRYNYFVKNVSRIRKDRMFTTDVENTSKIIQCSCIQTLYELNYYCFC